MLQLQFDNKNREAAYFKNQMDILAENLKMQDMRSSDHESQLNRHIEELNHKIRNLENDLLKASQSK